MRDFDLVYIENELALDPFFLTCNLCFAEQLNDVDRQAVLRTSFPDLYKPIGEWITSPAYENRPDDFSPPNFASFCKAVATKYIEAHADVNDQDVGKGLATHHTSEEMEDAEDNTGRKKPRKGLTTHNSQ